MRNSWLLIICIMCCLSLQAQIKIADKPNTTFTAGEVLNYRVHYGIIDAGEARIEVLPEIKTIGNRPCYHVVGTGRSLGAFDMFFKVSDRYESFIDSTGLVPWLFIRRVNEGGYKINQTVSFNHYNKVVTSQKSTLNMPEQLQDLISAFYYARNENFAQMKPGQILELKAWLDEEIIPLNLKFIGRETINTKFGKVNCIVLRPGLLEGRVFKSNEDLTLWISDDENKIPVRAQANILVGSIKMDLKSYSGLIAPFNKQKR
jgi:hypothetical protein